LKSENTNFKIYLLLLIQSCTTCPARQGVPGEQDKLRSNKWENMLAHGGNEGTKKGFCIGGRVGVLGRGNWNKEKTRHGRSAIAVNGVGGQNRGVFMVRGRKQEKGGESPQHLLHFVKETTTLKKGGKLD